MIPNLKLHILNGGYGNGDVSYLKKIARTSHLTIPWIVPKSAKGGDEIVINVPEHGLFASGEIASEPKLPKGSNWPRYRAPLRNVSLLKSPISLPELKKHIPEFAWAQYPRSITTPTDDIAKKIRALMRTSRTEAFDPNTSTLYELRKKALLRAKASSPASERKKIQRISSQAIRMYALRRAEGHCEGCGTEAPFLTASSAPYLEVHHTMRKADGGPDHPAKVIALCPNCHRRTEHSFDAASFNRSLIRKLGAIEKAVNRRRSR